MAVQFKDYYKILGVPRTASDTDIKKAFRKLAREFHPDVARDKKVAEEKFKEINEAYEVLGDAGKRKKYDELGPDWKSGADFRSPQGRRSAGHQGGFPSGPSSADFEFGGTGYSSFFEQLFGARMRDRSGRFSSAGAAERGQDMEGDIMVSLEEALKGSVRTVTVRHEDRTESHQVRIPPGVAEGQKLRLAGRGEHGVAGGPSGDLYLNVRFARNPDFEVSGSDLIHELDLAPWEAALGKEIAVPTLDGKVNIKIPSGTSSGQKLRVRARGLPQRDGGRGDLFVVTRLVLPAKMTDAQRQLWTQLASESNFNPRD